MSDDSEKDEISIGTGLKAAVKVALSNTAHTVIHPIHTAKALLGIEEERTIPEMIRDEEKRMSEQRRPRQVSHSGVEGS
jgi:hypothetical protein